MTRSFPGAALLLVAACATPGAPAPIAPPARATDTPAQVAWHDVQGPNAGPGLRFSDARAKIVALASTVMVQGGVAWAETKITLENPAATRLVGVLELATPEETFATDLEGEVRGVGRV